MSEILKALEALSAAHGSHALAEAFWSVRRAVQRQRREVHAATGNLAATLMAAIKIWDAQKAEGLPLADRQAALEQTLRLVWPHQREWHYLCATCADYGANMRECPGDATCGRPKIHPAHSYAEPCWCAAGLRLRAKPKPSPDDFQQAGRSKARKLTQIGQ